MLFNGILETTTSTTGNLTTSAVTGRPRFTDFFTANATESSADLFYYSVTSQDSPPKLYQQGLAHMSATGTLVRLQCIADYSSGTFSHWPGTIPDLPSGTKNIICTGEAASYVPGIYDMPFSASNNRRAIGPYHIQTSGATINMTKDRLYFCPILLPSPRRIASVDFEMGNTAGVGGTRGVRVGLYNSLKNGAPGRLIEQTADLAPGGYAVVTLTLSSATRFPPGLYFAAIANDYATTQPNIYGSSSANAMGMSPLGIQYNTGPNSIQGCYQSLTAGWTELPANAASASSLTPILVSMPIGLLKLE